VSSVKKKIRTHANDDASILDFVPKNCLSREHYQLERDFQILKF